MFCTSGITIRLPCYTEKKPITSSYKGVITPSILNKYILIYPLKCVPAVFTVAISKIKDDTMPRTLRYSWYNIWISLQNQDMLTVEVEGLL